MQESKYFYNNISISQYCKENELNIDNVRGNIWKKRQSSEYANYSDQEIVNMVIENYNKRKNYKYKNKSLRKYCAENDISYTKIYHRIKSLEKKYPKLSSDKIVKKAIENFKNGNFCYFYGDMTLVDYCKAHPQYNYRSIKQYIYENREKYPKLTDEELIEQYMNTEHNGSTKYYYVGISLKQYCEEKNYNYGSITKMIRTNKVKEEYKDFSDDDLVASVMDFYEPFSPKYFYKGITLRQYCLKNDISYYSVVSFVKRKKAKDKTLDIDNLIDEGIKTINRYGIIYYYKGIPLKDYAKEHDLNASSIRGAILREKAKTNRPLQEIVDTCVEAYQKLTTKYYYNNQSLYSACKNIGVNYNTIVSRYLYHFASNSKLSVDDAINEIVQYYLKNPPIKTKYYFNNQSVAKFCNNKGYSYHTVYRKIRYLENKKDSDENDKIVNIAIKKYEEKLNIKRINEVFSYLKSDNGIETDCIEKICQFLKINIEYVYDLGNMDFSYNQAINLIWYFYDVKNENEEKGITDKKIQEIFAIIENLQKASKEELKNYKLYDLIGIYKSELYDTRNEILMKQEKYINHVLHSICSSYNISLNQNNYEDFESEIRFNFIKVLDKTNLNVVGQIIKFIDLTIKGSFKTYVINYINNNNISLYSNKYMKDSANNKRLIDDIADPINEYDKLENTSFSNKMRHILSTLPNDDLSFIMMKFQDDYTEEDIASIYNLNLEEVREKEKRILKQLRDIEEVKVMQKSINK